MKNTKILYATTHLPPDNHFGGVVQSGYAMITALKEQLDNLTICCVSKNPKKIRQYVSYDTICAKSRFFHRWGFAPEFGSKFQGVARKADIVGINGIFTYPMTVAANICRELKKPYVVSLRGGLLPKAFSRKKWRKMVFLKLFARPILQDASMIHATSPAEIDCLKKMGIKTPVTLIPNGANLPPCNIDFKRHLPDKVRSLPEDSPMVLFLGRIDPIKGLDLLLASWAEMLGKCNNSKPTLVIAGPDERHYLHKIKTLAAKLGINDSLIFLEMVDGPSKWALYNRADLFVLPSYSESFGLVVTEAFACGTPVIATKSTPWEMIAKENAGRYISAEKQAFGNALCEMLNMPTHQRKQMGENGKRIILENYTWQASAQKMAAVYEQVLNGDKIPLIPRL